MSELDIWMVLEHKHRSKALKHKELYESYKKKADEIMEIIIQKEKELAANEPN